MSEIAQFKIAVERLIEVARSKADEAQSEVRRGSARVSGFMEAIGVCGGEDDAVKRRLVKRMAKEEEKLKHAQEYYACLLVRLETLKEAITLTEETP